MLAIIILCCNLAKNLCPLSVLSANAGTGSYTAAFQRELTVGVSL